MTDIILRIKCLLLVDHVLYIYSEVPTMFDLVIKLILRSLPSCPQLIFISCVQKTMLFHASLVALLPLVLATGYRNNARIALPSQASS
jgi:hypothetical protein